MTENNNIAAASSLLVIALQAALSPAMHGGFIVINLQCNSVVRAEVLDHLPPATFANIKPFLFLQTKTFHQKFLASVDLTSNMHCTYIV